MKQRFKVVLEQHVSRQHKTKSAITAGSVLVMDAKRVWSPAVFKDVEFADLVTKLLNENER